MKIALFFLTAFLVFPALGKGKAVVEGSTYFFKRALPLLKGQSCSQSLDQLAALLFGPNREHQHLSAYSNLICYPDPQTPLQAEVLFEPWQEEDRAELENWMQVLAQQTWDDGQSLRPQYVNTIFWDTYGAALKADNTYAGTFEKPQVSHSFLGIVEAKNALKAGLVAPKVDAFHEVLLQQIGDREFARWQKEVLPSTNMFAVQIAIYFLTAEGTAEKSMLNYQLSRDCLVLSCQ